MRIRVRVHPSSKERRVEKGEVVEVWVRSPAENGMANREMIELLEKEFGCRARIVKGFKRPLKTVELIGR